MTATRVKHVPHIPPQYLNELIDAMKECHDELLEPPEAIRDDSKKLVAWKPRVRGDVDWNVVRTGQLAQDSRAVVDVSTNNTDALQHPEEEEEEGVQEQGSEPENGPLTIGVIGQPNVGKSSVSFISVRYVYKLGLTSQLGYSCSMPCSAPSKSRLHERRARSVPTGSNSLQQSLKTRSSPRRNTSKRSSGHHPSVSSIVQVSSFPTSFQWNCKSSAPPCPSPKSPRYQAAYTSPLTAYL